MSLNASQANPVTCKTEDTKVFNLYPPAVSNVLSLELMFLVIAHTKY